MTSIYLELGPNSLRRPFRAFRNLDLEPQGSRPGLSCWTPSGSLVSRQKLIRPAHITPERLRQARRALEETTSIVGRMDPAAVAQLAQLAPLWPQLHRGWGRASGEAGATHDPAHTRVGRGGGGGPAEALSRRFRAC